MVYDVRRAGVLMHHTRRMRSWTLQQLDEERDGCGPETCTEQERSQPESSDDISVSGLRLRPHLSCLQARRIVMLREQQEEWMWQATCGRSPRRGVLVVRSPKQHATCPQHQVAGHRQTHCPERESPDKDRRWLLADPPRLPIWIKVQASGQVLMSQPSGL